MAKFTAGKKSKWQKNPFTIGREGPEFIPDAFGENRGTSPKTVPTGSIGSGVGSGKRFSRKKKVPKKIT